MHVSTNGCVFRRNEANRRESREKIGEKLLVNKNCQFSSTKNYIQDYYLFPQFYYLLKISFDIKYLCIDDLSSCEKTFVLAAANSIRDTGWA